MRTMQLLITHVSRSSRLPSSLQTFSSAYSLEHSVCLPWKWQTKFHTHLKQQTGISKYIKLFRLTFNDVIWPSVQTFRRRLSAPSVAIVTGRFCGFPLSSRQKLGLSFTPRPLPSTSLPFGSIQSWDSNGVFKQTAKQSHIRQSKSVSENNVKSELCYN